MQSDLRTKTNYGLLKKSKFCSHFPKILLILLYYLKYHSNAFAYGLAELGYKPGDRLGMWLEKSYTSETVAAQLGALKAGVAITPFSVEKVNELESLLQESGVKGLLYIYIYTYIVLKILKNQYLIKVFYFLLIAN